MEKLPMCRICLAKNVRMSAVVNKNLQELYERLTDIPFVTDDSRPVLACSFCCAKLKQCFRFLRKCLEAEELFAQIINGTYEQKPLINQDHLEVAHGFIISPIVNISIVEVCQTECVVVKEELPAVFERQDVILEPKEEYQSDELENLDNSRLDEEYILPHGSEYNSEDDVPLMEFKIEEEEEQEASMEKHRAVDTKRPTVAEEPKLHLRSTQLEDSIPADQKTNQISDSKIIGTTQNHKDNKQKERNREYQRAWRQRKKDLKKKVSKEEKEAEKRKRHCKNQRAYYQRIKSLKENDKNVEELFQKKLDDLQMKRQKLDSNVDQENVVQCRASQNLENVQLEQNQFLAQQLRIYKESHECINPEVILHRNTDIPSDGNCLFHSLIRVLQLQISTCDLRRQLRDSSYLNTCHNPQEAYNILLSNNEYGDLDCLYLFAKIYNQNICVHYHYFNVISNNEDTRFCHFKANETHNWIHLDLRQLHFTPYFSDDGKMKEDERKQKQKNKEYSKRYRDKKRTSQTGPSARDVLHFHNVTISTCAV